MEILTERLLLRDFIADDWMAVHAYQSDERYLRYYAWDHRTEADARDFVHVLLAMQQANPRIKYQLGIEHRASGLLIGNCGIRKAAHDAVEAELGYELAPNAWGNGYATEAARSMISFAFMELSLHRISAYCVAENQASARVLERLGMQLEGRTREKAYYKGRWWDELHYGLLVSEWAETGWTEQ